eukprot:12397021-Alexandrium_andersonii.AAC.1
MSASLVGSEMCIRDSISLRLHRDACGMRGVKHSTVLARDGRKEAWRLACLLYTSDAADDM